ncbi:hypothetical protein [Psychroserpens sp. MEBiC05023]
MKLITKFLFLVCISLIFIGCDKFKPTKQSSDSFKRVFNSVHWNNAKPYKKSIKNTCSIDLLSMALDSLPKQFYVDSGSHAELHGYLSDINAAFDNLVKANDLESKLAEDTGLIKISAKDKVLNAWSGAKNSRDFIKRVKTRRDGKPVDWEFKEKALDNELLNLYNEIESTFTVTGTYTTINNCRVIINQAISIKKITPTKVTLIPFCAMFFECKCTAKSTKKDLKKGQIVFSTVVEATFHNTPLDFNSMIFKAKGEPVYNIYEANCCSINTEKKKQ